MANPLAPGSDLNPFVANLVSQNAVVEENLLLSDVLTANASVLKHGFLPKLSGNAADYLNGLGQWSSVLGSLTSIGLTMPNVFTVTNSPLTINGVISVGFVAQAAHKVLVGPTTGSDAAPTFRTLAVADIPNLGSIYQATLISGTNIKTINSVSLLGSGDIAVSGTGTVTNVSSANANLTVTSPTTTPIITVVAAPKWATARNIAGNSVDGSANVAFANKFIVQGTVDAGLSGAQFLGALGTGILKNTTTTGVFSIAVAADFPALNQNTTGTAANLSGTPALPNGTTATTQSQADSSTKLATTAYVDTGLAGKISTGVQSANLFLASPNGSSGSPTFRAIVAADIPTLNQNTTGSAATLTTARTIGGVSFNGSANIPVATATGGFTVSGGNLAVGSNDLTMTGSLGSTGSRLTKGWFTDLQVTNAINGSVTGNAGTVTNGVYTGDAGTVFLAPNGSAAALTSFPTLNQNTTGSSAKWTTTRNLAGNSVDGSANVAFSNAFVVQGTADSGLSGAQFLGALATGIVKVTTTTGILSIATGADLPTMTATVGGAVPTPPNNTSTFLRGDGTFATPSGGGNVSNTGTPTSGQAAEWTNATTVQGVPVTGSGNYVKATSPTLVTAVLGSSTATTQSPNDNSTKLATTAYVDAAITGLDAKDPVAFAQTSALPANTYANGTLGVGATLTANSNGFLLLDGVTLTASYNGLKVLVAGESTAANNGWYIITDVGSLVTKYLLTRDPASDQAAEIESGYITGVVAPSGLTAGSNNGRAFISSAPAPFVVGTDSVTFSLVGATYSVGYGLSVSGSTVFSIDTGVTVDKTTAQVLTNKDMSSGTNTWPTFNQNTTGSAAKLSISGQTGLLTFTGLASTNRIKTVRDAADTILELGGSYTPTGNWTSLTMITPVLGTPASGNLANCTFPTLNQNTTGSAAKLTTARTINGVDFDGTAPITVTAAAGTLSGTALNSTVVTSSLTSVGTLSGLTEIVSDAATGGTSTGATYGHDTSGTAGAGFGSVYKYQLQDSTTADIDAGNFTYTWATATHASRKARAVFNIYDTAVREGLRIEASGTAPMIGFLGANASAVLASPDVGTALTTFGLATGTPTFGAANLTGATLAAAVTASSLTSFGASIVLGTPASGTLTNCTVGVAAAPATTAVGYLGIPQNSKSAAYTTVMGDAGGHILHPSGDANARTFTIDSNANVAYPIGTTLTFINQTSQVLSIAITTDTMTLANTTTTGTRSLAQNGVASALKITSTSWIISGNGLT